MSKGIRPRGNSYLVDVTYRGTCKTATVHTSAIRQALPRAADVLTGLGPSL